MVFERLCPQYMLYGMTYEQYWFGDPWMARAYAQMHLLKRKQLNEELWMNGLYTTKALSVVMNNAFNKRKEKYFEKPLDIFPKTDAEIEEENREKRIKVVKMLQEWKRQADLQKKMGVDQDGSHS